MYKIDGLVSIQSCTLFFSDSCCIILKCSSFFISAKVQSRFWEDQRKDDRAEGAPGWHQHRSLCPRQQAAERRTHSAEQSIKPEDMAAQKKPLHLFLSVSRLSTSRTRRRSSQSSTCPWTWWKWRTLKRPRRWSATRTTGSHCTSTPHCLTTWRCRRPRRHTLCRARWDCRPPPSKVHRSNFTTLHAVSVNDVEISTIQLFNSKNRNTI